MLQCLVQKWGANVRAISLLGERDCYPIFKAAIGGAHEVVAFFLDECGMDVNLQTPRAKDTILHVLMRYRPPVKKEAMRLLTYLVEEKGADFTIKNADGQNARDLSFQFMNGAYFTYFLGFDHELPENAKDLYNSDEWGSAEDERQILLAAGAMASKAEEAEAKVLFDEQEAKAKEATAALLAELDAEDRKAAAETGKEESNKNGNKKKGAGSQQQQASLAVLTGAAAARGGVGVGGKECKARDKKREPRRQEEEQHLGRQQQQDGQAGEQQPYPRRQQCRGATQNAADAAAAVAAVSMGDLSLEEENGAGTASSKDAEDNLEGEKQDFFFDGAPDGLKCSVGFCLMTEAVVATDGFSYQKSALDEHIAHCAAKGQALTSPMTGEAMDGMYLPNQNVRTLVKDYIEQREKEWSLHLAQRRAEREKGK